MPIQPPSSISQQQPPPASTTAGGGLGLSRNRSLRRPQAGPSASAAAASDSATGTRAAPYISTSHAASSGIPTRGSSPSRLPTKPASTSAGTAATTTGGVRQRPPSATGGVASARLRKLEGTAASSSSSATAALARPFTKPPSSSRTYLIPSSSAAPSAGTTQRRPTSSGGLPSHQSSSSASTAAPFGQLSRTRPAATAASGPVRGHTRNKSASIISTPTTSATSTTAAAKPSSRPPSSARQPSRPPSATTLSSATVLRPPSAQSTSTGSSGTSRPPTRGATTASTTTATTSTTTKVSTTTHRRQASATAGAGAAAAAQHRPAFSTHQQHFSPAKNTAPKPRIAAILAPPASPSKKPTNVAISAETGRLQTTLLQLHLLHRDAATVTAEWHASARQALAGERFSGLAAEHAELVQMAGQRSESVNAAALQEWGDSPSYGNDGPFDLTLEEKIQALDSVLSGVWSLTGQDAAHGQGQDKSDAPTSRYVQVVRRFERWAQQTADLVAARRGIDSLEDLLDEDEHHRGGNNKAVAAGFLCNEKEPLLDAAWHGECSNLTYRLEGWQIQLGRLGKIGGSNTKTGGDNNAPHQPQSSLHRILAGCSSLVDGMLEELRMMQQLEQDAAEQELEWIRKMNTTAGLDGSSGGLDLQSHVAQQPARAGAIWRLL
ncbi:hypothetical protein SEUCBS139899_005355 [Sporothrix eucalyptigena]